MTSTIQRAELQSKIWKIANDVRGAVDGWDFKQFVLGTLFYRFISENFTNYIEAGDDSVNYANLPDSVITPEIKDDAIKTKGYFIYPSQLFVNIAKTANTNTNLNTDLKAIFDAIESSANGYPSEQDIKGLFADFDTTSTRLGNTVENKNSRLAAVIKGVEELNFGNFEKNQIDLFGDAYEFLISNYAANAGKSGGEFFTPQSVSKLIAQLAMHKQTTVNKIYDPAAGSGSLLLQAKKHFDNHIIEEGFFGQEINHTTYNLARMNMFLHNINYDKFNIALGNTLIDPHFGDDKPFDAIVSNPPYSVNWIGSDDPTLINDDRFAPAGVLAPKSKADFAFVLHALSYLSAKGRAAIVCFPGIFYRGGAEQKIRKYLVDNNFVESVISLAPNLFYGTSIAVNILVLSKSKTDTKTQFIDVSGEGFFQKVTNNNVLTDKHIEKIMEMFDSKADVAHVAKSVDYNIITKNDYNLTVSEYVKPKDTQEKIDIDELNKEISDIADKIDSLRAEIDVIVKNIGSESGMGFIENLLDGIEIEWKPISKALIRTKGTKITAEQMKKLHNNQAPLKIFAGGKTVASVDYKDIPEKDVNREPSIIVKSRGVIEFEYYDKPFSHKNEMWSYHSKNEYLDIKFIYYFLKINEPYFQNIGNRMQMPQISTPDTEKFKIPIPCPRNPEKSLEIQKRIVCILDTFTELKVNLEKELETELKARGKQYEYYRDMLLTFPKDNLNA
ncbi:type I restriction-modification system subunit M [Solitalea sp. MAHUQ-68]|uniref:site-specific DNA-methyltransferase (adenine-specific) n=1 Tax=Solitalea agri TaxID=2953739 RepID=A0A9X2F7A2_9SPHI|nr:type I restriction-modification system subunit M [Solitalea agri]MCO4293058.1 type I restriction-modification system subunit M [Solitalea agri]